MEMLLYGHFLGTDTLFQNMHTLMPDSVSVWDSGRLVRSRLLWTVGPSDLRFGNSWDELVDEMHERTEKTISEVFKERREWILPLSGGMDSRLFACVGVEKGVKFKAYTYGPERWNETVYAKEVARVLRIPWERIDLGHHYLADFTGVWLDLFGSSLHAHGMYQFAFLKSIEYQQKPILHGYMGDPLAGNHLGVLRQGGSPHEKLCHFSQMWRSDELKTLLVFDPTTSLEEISELLQDQLNDLRGAEFQKNMFLGFWNRQRNFISYHPAMYHYWSYLAVPYMSRDYARFCLSLPSFALENRKLQKDMVGRYWPRASKVKMTSLHVTQKRLSLRGVLKRLIGYGLIGRQVSKVCKVLGFAPNTMELDCVWKTGTKALYPLTLKLDQEIFHDRVIRRTVGRALRLSQPDYTKASTLQPIVYRMLGQAFADPLENEKSDIYLERSGI